MIVTSHGEGKEGQEEQGVSEGPLYIGLPHQRCQKFATYGVPQHMDFTSALEVLWGANAMEAFSTPLLLQFIPLCLLTLDDRCEPNARVKVTLSQHSDNLYTT